MKDAAEKAPVRPKMFESTKVVVGIMAGFAGCCFVAAALVAVLPAFYADGTMKFDDAYLAAHDRAVTGRRGTVVRILHTEEIEYSVVILDSIGKRVAYVTSQRIPAPPDGEPIKYLPAMPEFYFPAAKYNLSTHVGCAAFLAACGLVSVAATRKLRMAGRRVETDISTAT